VSPLERVEVVEWLAGDGFGFVVVGTWIAVGLYYVATSWRRARRALRVLSDPAASVGGAPQGGDRRPRDPGRNPS
jgi:hypothetical protein